MVAAILGLLAKPIMGGVLGVFGSFLTQVVAYWNKKQDHKHALAMVVAESDCMIKEIEAGIKREVEKTKGLIGIEEMKAYIQSQKAGMVTTFHKEYMGVLLAPTANWFMKSVGTFIAFLLGIAEFAKASIRPGVTIYTVILVTLLALQFMGIMKEMGLAFTAEQVLGIVLMLIDAVIFMACTSVGWHFIRFARGYSRPCY